MLTGPMDATQHLLDRTGMSIADIDLFEINEAFASVVLAWAREVGADMANGSTRTAARSRSATRSARPARVLVTKALHELERTDGETRSSRMCCGGGLGTGTLIRRV